MIKNIGGKIQKNYGSYAPEAQQIEEPIYLSTYLSTHCISIIYLSILYTDTGKLWCIVGSGKAKSVHFVKQL